MISKSLIGIILKGVALQVVEPRYLMSVMTENNGVSERKQCLSCKCHISNIDFQEPLPSPTTSPLASVYALDLPDVMLGSISSLDL